jgi:hypothetical protein
VSIKTFLFCNLRLKITTITTTATHAAHVVFLSPLGRISFYFLLLWPLWGNIPSHSILNFFQFCLFEFSICLWVGIYFLQGTFDNYSELSSSLTPQLSWTFPSFSWGAATPLSLLTTSLSFFYWIFSHNWIYYTVWFWFCVP